MRIIAADDEKYALEELTAAIHDVRPEAELVTFQNPHRLLEYIQENSCDAAFLDIEMGSVSGMAAAKQIKQLHPKANIIFVTGYSRYMEEAFKIHASGYVCKPVRREEIRAELEDLRIPVLGKRQPGLVARCFGNFDVFVNGKNLDFERAKTKEMLAYLIDRRGSMVTSGELRAILWKNAKTDENTRSYLSKVQKDLSETLNRAGVGDVFVSSWGKYAIDKEKISCDYYDYLEDKPEGIRMFNGEYMSQYSWGEIRQVLQKHRR